MIPRTRVVGIDFSGARDAGNRMWIASGVLTDGGVRIEACHRARDLPDSAIERPTVMAALVAYIAGETKAVIGCDFPFGLPAELVEEASWGAFIAGFGARHADADAFRAACMNAAGGRELKRHTDVESRTPFSAYNLRIYRQTYEGIRNVIAPLLATDRVRAIPMQPLDVGKPILVEACPASLLKREGLYFPYKGRDDDRTNGRRRLVRELVARGLIAATTPRIRRRLIEDPGGDALDAVIAAIAAGRAIADPSAHRPRDAIEAIETRVFF